MSYADRASDKERFFITGYYFGRATGNQEKAQQVCDEWARTYPREFLPHSFLAGFVDLVLANYKGAVEEAQKVIELNPDASLGYYLLGYDLMYLNDLQGAENTVHMAAERNLDQVRMATLRFDLAYMKGDAAGMRREVEWAQAHPEIKDWILDRQAFAEASEGRLKNAINLSRHAVALALQGGKREQAAVFEIRAALWEAFFENPIEARRTATAALALAGNREVNYGAALALALSGDSTQAEKLANDMEKRYPEDTSVRFSYLPVIRAVVAVQHGEPLKAIDALQPSVPYEMGSPRSSQTGFFGSLYPVFFRGEALLAAHKGAEAANEFQKILSHRGITIGDPVLVLAHLGLARAYALSGESTKARAQYQEFFALWNGADPDILVLKRAKANSGPSADSVLNPADPVNVGSTCTAPDTAFIAVLQDVDDHGNATNVTAGYLRAGVDEAASKPGAPVLSCRTFEAIPIGEKVTHRIPLVPNCQRFRTGHTIRLHFATDDQRKDSPALLEFRHASVGTNSFNTVLSSSVQTLWGRSLESFPPSTRSSMEPGDARGAYLRYDFMISLIDLTISDSFLCAS